MNSTHLTPSDLPSLNLASLRHTPDLPFQGDSQPSGTCKKFIESNRTMDSENSQSNL